MAASAASGFPAFSARRMRACPSCERRRPSAATWENSRAPSVHDTVSSLSDARSGLRVTAAMLVTDEIDREVYADRASVTAAAADDEELSEKSAAADRAD